MDFKLIDWLFSRYRGVAINWIWQVYSTLEYSKYMYVVCMYCTMYSTCSSTIYEYVLLSCNYHVVLRCPYCILKWLIAACSGRRLGTSSWLRTTTRRSRPECASASSRAACFPVRSIARSSSTSAAATSLQFCLDWFCIDYSVYLLSSIIHIFSLSDYSNQ